MVAETLLHPSSGSTDSHQTWHVVRTEVASPRLTLKRLVSMKKMQISGDVRAKTQMKKKQAVKKRGRLWKMYSGYSEPYKPSLLPESTIENADNGQTSLHHRRKIQNTQKNFNSRDRNTSKVAGKPPLQTPMFSDHRTINLAGKIADDSVQTPDAISDQ
nr:hypothetical protein Iba_chr03cCG4790 [Ipomoea batatas]